MQNMNRKPDFDQYINKLKGSEYDELKYIWSLLSIEINNLYQSALNEDDGYSTDIFSQYQDAFYDEMENLVE